MARDDDSVRLRAELEELRAIVTMVAGLSHDLATPLGVINQGADFVVEALRDVDGQAEGAQSLDAEQWSDIAEAARLILANAAKARELVDGFKNLTVRSLSEPVETLDIESLLHEVAGLYRLRARGLTTRVVGPAADEERSWRGRSGALSRVLLNLLSNADRYAYPHGGGEITITLSRRDAGFAIAVADRGAGMTPEQVSRVFEPFYTSGRDRGGTGLGMAIVHDLVTHQLGGRVEVESELGEGTTVTVFLPANAPAETSQDG